jgi:hypothetical protein
MPKIRSCWPLFIITVPRSPGPLSVGYPIVPLCNFSRLYPLCLSLQSSMQNIYQLFSSQPKLYGAQCSDLDCNVGGNNIGAPQTTSALCESCFTVTVNICIKHVKGRLWSQVLWCLSQLRLDSWLLKWMIIQLLGGGGTPKRVCFAFVPVSRPTNMLEV